MSTPAPTPAPTPGSAPPTPTPPVGATASGARSPTKTSEIKLLSHSSLFYWWPVWVTSFIMALWTFVEGNRLAVVPPGGNVAESKGQYIYTHTPKAEGTINPSLQQAVANSQVGQEPFIPRVSQHTWPGTVFCFVLIFTVIITNVPLRGLWSAIVLVLLVFLVILFAFLKVWDNIFAGIESLRIHINLAGYLFIGLGTFAVWALATFLFDRRSYVIFTPGQIRVCEHVGASVQTYSTLGASLEKQRDDIFRHYILGFGSGDLILKIGTGEKKEIRLPNVLGIGSRLRTVEDMLRTMSTA